MEEQKINKLLIDVDNTLMTYAEIKPQLDVIHWIETAKSKGFNSHLISNNISKRRIQTVCTLLDCTGLYFACKPFIYSTLSYCQKHRINHKKSAFIGDQLIKDTAI